MIKKCICSLCQKEFDFEYYGNSYEKECFKHEVIDHLRGDIVCEDIIKSVVNELNQEYKLNFTIKDYEFNPYYKVWDSSVCGNEIDLSFKLQTSSDIFIRLTTTCIDGEISLTKEKITEMIKKYYIEESEKQITGVVEFEDWCGGNGADDYVINGMYLRDIMKRLKGKKILIQILED